MHEKKKVKYVVLGISGPFLVIGGILLTVILSVIHPFLGLIGVSLGVMSYINFLDTPDRDREGNEIKRKWYSVNSRVRNLLFGFVGLIALLFLWASF